MPQGQQTTYCSPKRLQGLQEDQRVSTLGALGHFDYAFLLMQNDLSEETSSGTSRQLCSTSQKLSAPTRILLE